MKRRHLIIWPWNVHVNPDSIDLAAPADDGLNVPYISVNIDQYQGILMRYLRKRQVLYGKDHTSTTNFLNKNNVQIVHLGYHSVNCQTQNQDITWHMENFDLKLESKSMIN